MTKSTPQKTEKIINNHKDLVEQLPNILSEINADPVLNRLVLINPLHVLEDLGYTLSPQLQKHIRNTLGFPKPLLRRMVALRDRLRSQIREAVPDEATVRIPKSPKERAKLLFKTMALDRGGRHPEALTVEQLPQYRQLHPVVETLYELGRLERGGLTYHTRGTYEACKGGRIHHPWIKRLTFRTEG